MLSPVSDLGAVQPHLILAILLAAIGELEGTFFLCWQRSLSRLTLQHFLLSHPGQGARQAVKFTLSQPGKWQSRNTFNKEDKISLQSRKTVRFSVVISSPRL